MIKKSNKRKIIPKQIQCNKKCPLYKTDRTQIWKEYYERNKTVNRVLKNFPHF